MSFRTRNNNNKISNNNDFDDIGSPFGNGDDDNEISMKNEDIKKKPSAIREAIQTLRRGNGWLIALIILSIGALTFLIISLARMNSKVNTFASKLDATTQTVDETSQQVDSTINKVDAFISAGTPTVEKIQTLTNAADCAICKLCTLGKDVLPKGICGTDDKDCFNTGHCNRKYGIDLQQEELVNLIKSTCGQAKKPIPGVYVKKSPTTRRTTIPPAGAAIRRKRHINSSVGAPPPGVYSTYSRDDLMGKC